MNYDGRGALLFVTVIGLVLVAIVATIDLVDKGWPVSRSAAVQHGCAVYDCDSETGDCTFRWRDEQPGGRPNATE